MCLIVNKKDFKVEVAEEDITVYKLVLRRNDDMFSSYFHDFVWEKGKTYNLDKGLNPVEVIDLLFFDAIAKEFINMDDTIISISEGFHSAASYDRLIRMNDAGIIITCIIPVGSTYIKDMSGLIVSDVLKII